MTSLMEGRKMAIVPFKLWEDMNRWKEEQIQKPRLPPNPNVSATASLQRDLSSVMANEDLSEAEKSQLYGQTLYKFKVAHEKALKEQSSKLLPSLAKTTTSTHSKINQLIVDSVPKMFKRKAQLLLSILQDNPNMSWDEDGTVKLYGKPIQGSNIIDLVNDVVRQNFVKTFMIGTGLRSKQKIICYKDGFQTDCSLAWCLIKDSMVLIQPIPSSSNILISVNWM